MSNDRRSMSRRTFMQTSAGAAVAATMGGRMVNASIQDDNASKPPLFRISLAQWSLHRMLRRRELEAVAFPTFTRERFNIEAVEYVNSFFKDSARDAAFLNELNRRCNDADVKSLLIMVDGEGRLGDPDPAERTKAITNHHRWVEAARDLGCHSIRVNAASAGSPDEQRKLAADGLRRLTDFAAERDLNVIVENHGGLSSNGEWLAGVMREVDHQRCGTLPDFGNFSLGGGKWYDRYQGVKELMPFAKAVSAKSHDFDDDGYETHTDYERMMRIVLDAGYRGWIGVEYEGDGFSEVEGVLATKRLLERVRAKLSVDPAYRV